MQPLPLKDGIRSRFIPHINGMTMHVLEAGYETSKRPCVLLLHGFPELAYSWRKVMPVLARAGYHVIAPDQRGFGRTTGWDSRYECDLNPFRLYNVVRDTVALVTAMGYRWVSAVVGHDFGSPVAAWCALIRPDIFRSVVMMSAAFPGAPELPFNTALGTVTTPGIPKYNDIDAELGMLDPPRKHYHWYYSTREANDDMWHCPQGVHSFMRAYYHHKSADWKANIPFRLAGWIAPELAKMPTYYIMNKNEGMAQTAAAHMPTDQEIAACMWLTDDELRVYSTEYERTGYQGGLNWYRCRTSGFYNADLEVFSGRTIDVPAGYISGKSDWGVYQKPGDLERMQTHACTDFVSMQLVDGAGHWVQQEQPDAVNEFLLKFLRR